MIRSLLAVIAGQLSIAFLSGFTRLVVALYFRIDLQLTGVSHFPSLFWQYALVILSAAFGILGGLVTCSVAREKYGTEILALICLIIAMGLFEYQFLHEAEPVWYLILSPLVKAAGVWAGYRVKLSQDRELSASA